ncbi:aldehyde dehydrogenase family protein [Nocardiopsis flavescens]|uniref:aldehyde dehydrogenase family protein n=1 Tax=Nocardiopsis flavescens TaxID=758803 RepID=UPI00364CE54E
MAATGTSGRAAPDGTAAGAGTGPGPGVELPLLTVEGRRRTRARETVNGVDGRPCASLSLAPELLVARTLARQARTEPLPAGRRERALREAAERFLEDTLGGLAFGEHLARVGRVSGHNAPLTARMSEQVAAALAQAPQRADQARPRGSVRSREEVPQGSGRGVWTRRGRTLGAVLSGNAPTIQNGWLQALALGYRVAVRPSRREPFTAHRVVLALRAAGFRGVDAVYLPTTRAVAGSVLRRADLGLTYGGDDVEAAYGRDPSVKVGGPGRSKTLITRERLRPAAVASVAESVSALSGTACVNTSAVLVEGDHVSFARALAEELRGLTGNGGLQTTDRHLGPRLPEAAALALLDGLRRSGPGEPVIPWDRVAARHPDGGVVLGPAVLTVDTPEHPLLRSELPFPCVWVAPWRPEDGLTALGGSLVVNAITEDTGLVDALAADPTIRNVHQNAPTVRGDGLLPHEDYVGGFLMRNKAVVIGAR